jgi:hypothetical protein
MNAIGGFSAPLNGVRRGHPTKMSSHQETVGFGLSGIHTTTNVEMSADRGHRNFFTLSLIFSSAEPIAALWDWTQAIGPQGNA